MDPLREGAVEVVRRLRAAGHPAYFAGGCVRDRLLGRPIADYDIATGARPDDVERLFERTVPVGRSFGVVVVLLGDRSYQVATFRRDGPYLDGRRPEAVTFADAKADAERRDFTINGMFHDPIEDRLHDFVGGRKDLEARVLRAIGDPGARFGEDALRLLRAVRFAAQLGFSIDPATDAAITRLAPTIGRVSAERIAEELRKLLPDPGRVAGLELLHRSGLLREILPEVAAMEGVPQPPEYHPEGDVWTHTKLAMKALERPTFLVALATLLHDVGKPPTMTKTDRIRFNGHDALGATMAKAIGRRLKLPNDEVDTLEWLVGRHLVFLNWPGLRPATLKRLFADPRIDDLLALVRADTIGSLADTAYLGEIEAARRAIPPEELKPEPLLTGHDLIALGMAPGPDFRKLLDELEEERLEGRILDREAALAWLKSRRPPPKA